VSDTRLTLRVDFGSGRSVGPGKVRLLEAIDSTGSISQAGRMLGMSYRRAWLLVDTMNHAFRAPLVEAAKGGAGGGGARVTELGLDVLARYRAMELKAAASVAAEMREFTRFLVTRRG
jgi:molybdate transport system regulatory protein